MPCFEKLLKRPGCQRIEALIESRMKGEVANAGGEDSWETSGQEHDGSAKGDRGILEVVVLVI
jgi:hypothetical protein